MSEARDSGEFASPPPRRWLDDASGATDAERAVLRTGVSVDPPAGADRKVWLAIAAKIGPIGGGGGGGGGGAGPGAGTAAAKGAAAATSAAAAGGGIVTSALIGGACAVALLVGSSALESRRPESPTKHDTPAIVAAPKPIEAAKAPVPQTIAAPPASAALAVDARADPSASPTAAAKPSDVAPARSADLPNLDPGAPRGANVAPSDPGGSGASGFDPGGAVGAGDAASRLREESQLLSQARDALHAGDVARCFGLLETARTRFSSGGLGQEREALTIEALARSGNSGLASERANAFLRTYPNSPHAARVKTFAQ